MQHELSFDDYMKELDAMTELSSLITGEESERDFLYKLLEVAVRSISEAKCGSIWKIEGAIYKPIVGYCYDEKMLSKIEFPLEDSYIKQHFDDDLIEVENIKHYDHIGNKSMEILQNIHKNKERMLTLICPLKISGKVVGHLYIDNFQIKKFSDFTKKMIKMFSSFASIFLTLKNARDHEKEANELNTVYLSFITHELRTPLTAILGYAQTVLSRKNMNADEMREFVKRIYTSAKHLNSLIEDISSFNKLNRETSLRIAEFNIKHILYESISIVETSLSPECVLNVDIPHDIPLTIETDQTKLIQILVNIIGNSVKYTDEGKVEVKINFDNKTKHFIIVVNDTGPGVPKERVKELFKPFVRLSKDKPGSGLGLAIVKKTVKMLKGKIHI